MKGVIRIGDPTSHGGQVIAGAPTKTVNGIPVARVGDACTCPKKGHSGCVVAEGDPTVMIEGIPVAFHGHKTSCGASLISTIPTSGKD
ncbi:PAAR domain-containing protein [Janthinobacterium sp. 17J80-10]|uniref:PAAR domain-containing protein n=1 Tax=Janthinobacterium sp. 17J80-10 TaxID=2497863 RepID=UPI00100597C9|nr:PAAR domain-containing protein [Janthinobacterium sp. 17J80-10]QAU34921.1 PAAR domain-containing protein [Janthinobacterium sp. 17J80-10]